MSSILNSQGVVLATAMAVSGTVILLALRLQRSFPDAQFQPPPPLPRSCISSDGKKREKKKKRVQFAEDVVDPVGNSDDFRKQHSSCNKNIDHLPSNSSSKPRERRGGVRDMPANRVALYNGMLRDRLVHRHLAYSY
ncbi:uncharacterized protein LOC130771212 [Actinidia eriantha]|uniref:uncharacterized protein LOC130771212 n=1 Tax=Actinidia eriantha TaxID=165200 RepID=UPI00258E09AE|nr:uncharacterized protein LOC130771212 [Actinidia eriantha]XP_057484775.1 uncharacterized protein LOC130771212 [Actinidia eriantha]